MNFKSLYEIFHKLKISCDITKQFKIKKIMFGFGGSDNIILGIGQNHDKLAIKIIPDVVYQNVKIKPNRSQLEIKFYKFFTNKYVLKNRSPHIVGIYNHQKCSNIDKLLNNIKKKPCPSYEDKLTKKIRFNLTNEKICDLLEKFKSNLISQNFDAICLEYCPEQLSQYIEINMYMVRDFSGNKLKNIIDQFIYNLNRFLFQIIFTLAIIKDDYPGFLHGDFFTRNILLSPEFRYKDNEYAAYHYKQKIFYLQANGWYAKINDFDSCIIINELEPSDLKFNKDLNKFYHKNPFNEKTDIFNLLHDIYDGQNLGTLSINRLAAELNIPYSKIKVLKEFLGNFLKVGVIDKINDANYELLSGTWDIDGIKILENTVLTPNQYLNHFEIFQELPPGSKIVQHFNANNSMWNNSK
ncbi:MAG: putative serine threonine protein kinase [Satyrvirus sp.]|uniref:Putative serine threonine protein kinase n=1 Tax=Satyrvirus sp. TaxID=2487771 RepID=A0A3G5AEQ9_9VIRU|nr:MAG: putative serine threonine protein kinase [Satyrvirus sp.]